MLLHFIVSLSICACDEKLLKQYKNLKSLTKTDGEYSGVDGMHTWRANFRKALEMNGTCTTADCNFYRINQWTCECRGDFTNETCDELPDSMGIWFNYEYKMFTSPFTVRWNIYCDKTQETVTAENVDSTSLSITVNARGKWGCPSGGGMGWGWVFNIILLAALVLLFAIGIPINKFARKKSGIEIIPFVYFWVGIPRMVMEGVKCLFTPCRKKQRGFDPLE